MNELEELKLKYYNLDIEFKDLLNKNKNSKVYLDSVKKSKDCINCPNYVEKIKFLKKAGQEIQAQLFEKTEYSNKISDKITVLSDEQLKLETENRALNIEIEKLKSQKSYKDEIEDLKKEKSIMRKYINMQNAQLKIAINQCCPFCIDSSEVIRELIDEDDEIIPIDVIDRDLFTRYNGAKHCLSWLMECNKKLIEENETLKNQLKEMQPKDLENNSNKIHKRPSKLSKTKQKAIEYYFCNSYTENQLLKPQSKSENKECQTNEMWLSDLDKCNNKNKVFDNSVALYSNIEVDNKLLKDIILENDKENMSYASIAGNSFLNDCSRQYFTLIDLNGFLPMFSANVDIDASTLYENNNSITFFSNQSVVVVDNHDLKNNVENKLEVEILNDNDLCVVEAMASYTYINEQFLTEITSSDDTESHNLRSNNDLIDEKQSGKSIIEHGTINIILSNEKNSEIEIQDEIYFLKDFDIVEPNEYSNKFLIKESVEHMNSQDKYEDRSENDESLFILNTNITKHDDMIIDSEFMSRNSGVDLNVITSINIQIESKGNVDNSPIATPSKLSKIDIEPESIMEMSTIETPICNENSSVYEIPMDFTNNTELGIISQISASSSSPFMEEENDNLVDYISNKNKQMVNDRLENVHEVYNPYNYNLNKRKRPIISTQTKPNPIIFIDLSHDTEEVESILLNLISKNNAEFENDCNLRINLESESVAIFYITEAITFVKKYSFGKFKKSNLVQSVYFFLMCIFCKFPDLFRFYYNHLMASFDFMELAIIRVFLAINLSIYSALKRPDLLILFILDLIKIDKIPLAMLIKLIQPDLISVELNNKCKSVIILLKHLVLYEYLTNYNSKMIIDKMSVDSKKFWLNQNAQYNTNINNLRNFIDKAIADVQRNFFNLNLKSLFINIGKRYSKT